jgi:hypothetical protein
MATINPPLAQEQTTKELFPLPLDSEVFILKREDISFETKCPKLGKLTGKGYFVLSSRRLVFIVENESGNRKDFGSFEILLNGIIKQEFQQPIFGENEILIALGFMSSYYFLLNAA